jgi:hypothetical protein
VELVLLSLFNDPMVTVILLLIVKQESQASLASLLTHHIYGFMYVLVNQLVFLSICYTNLSENSS